VGPGQPTPEGEPGAAGLDAAARVAAALGSGGGERWFRAPGRVNLIGEHTDYNDGLVLPLAVDRSCVVAARPGDVVRVRSLDTGSVVELAPDGAFDPAATRPAWGRYVAGVVAELAALGRPAVGLEAVLASDVPLGAGLSSSAALEVACAVALADAAGWTAPPAALAEACRRAEELATGVPCGIMDQLASVAGVAGHALLVDCRDLDVRPVALPPRLAILVVHSGVARSLDASPYAERRRACEELARRLGVPALRDATEGQVAHEPLGRHVVSENARVLAAANALEDGDLARLGELLVASHASLRDDFRVSVPELDVLVEELLGAGALGARLTGGGFGGCVVAVCDELEADGIARVATERYAGRTGLEPRPFRCRAMGGAGPLDRPAGKSG
jgi:galactokinase